MTRPPVSTMAGEWLDYRLQRPARAVHPGSHRAQVSGAGDEFRGVVPLAEGRDARRLDLRATSADPWERTWVREFRQRSRVPVWLAADLSASMRFVGHSDRITQCERFAAALAQASFRRGDPFGFLAFDHTVRRDLAVPASASRIGGERVAQRLRAWRAATFGAQAKPTRHGADGMADLARWLPRQRALVFVLSDLYLPEALLGLALRRLRRHEVVLVMLADSAERQPPARFGLARLADLESGQERLVLLRPALAQRMAQAQAERRAAAAAMARREGARLIVVDDVLDLPGVAAQLLGRRTGNPP